MGIPRYWIRIEGRGYFVRFESHDPPKWFTHQELRRAYCFATLAEASRVANQLKAYGRTATVVTQRRSEPQRAQVSSTVPPTRLRPWIDRILSAGEATRSSGTEHIKIGYRALARRHHPDVGGSTADMQALSEAFDWLQQHHADVRNDEIPF